MLKDFCLSDSEKTLESQWEQFNKETSPTDSAPKTMGFFLFSMKRRSEREENGPFIPCGQKIELLIPSPGWQPPIYRNRLDSLGVYTEIHLDLVT